MQEVYSQKVVEQVMDLLEEDEALGPRILQLHRQGFFDNKPQSDAEETVMPDAPFPRGVTHHSKLTLKNLDYLFRELGLQAETVDAICAKSKLQACRWLWCWFNDCDMQDKLPATTSTSLLAWASSRQCDLVEPKP